MVILKVKYIFFPVSDRSATEPEINAQLDSLCLSMTNHALDGPGKYFLKANGNFSLNK